MLSNRVPCHKIRGVIKERGVEGWASSEEKLWEGKKDFCCAPVWKRPTRTVLRYSSFIYGV
jgi:hypothetical protein